MWEGFAAIIAVMDFSSKDYDKIRVSRGRGRRGASSRSSSPSPASGVGADVMSRCCAWPGCKAKAEYRAPKGRDHEGEYLWFCLDHVREYNKGYNYFDGMKDDDVLAYQRDASTGHRPTRPIGVRGKERAKARATYRDKIDDPFGVMGEGFAEGRPKREARKVRAPERNAFEVMGLPESASKQAIKTRYKELVKKHHPDANKGDRSSEDRLRSVINAYAVLRRAGYC